MVDMSQTTAPASDYAITLGTAGGPRFWQDSNRCGISTAIVVEDGFYIVDCGQGVGRQIVKAGLDPAKLKGIFITHLHSDHTVDLNGLVLFSLVHLQHRLGDPVPIVGPGDRGILPPLSPRATKAPSPFSTGSPTPGTREMFRKLMEANATDLNDRIIDSLRPSPMDLFNARDIEIPGDSDFHPNDNPTPDMNPFEVFRDGMAAVSAILVKHPPLAPAFAFRFDTAQGAVVVSGDTAYTENMVNISSGADLLLHEALDFDYMESRYGGKGDETSKASLEHHYKSHSSVDDAVRVAEQASVQKLAIHHLVPGFGDKAMWLEKGRHFSGEFHVPDDLETIEFGPAVAH